ncbi:MAG: transcription termination factor Rho, partial [Planctomycetota bacterium]
MDRGYVAGRLDPVVPAKVADRLGLRGGETLEVRAPANPRGGSPPSVRLEDVRTIDGRPADDREAGIPFEKLTAIDPREPIRFETPDGPLSMRVVDLMTPIGFGQRGLIVAPPRTGKTILLQQMAAGVAANHPQAHLMMLLIDERPEEVTDMRRT